MEIGRQTLFVKFLVCARNAKKISDSKNCLNFAIWIPNFWTNHFSKIWKSLLKPQRTAINFEIIRELPPLFSADDDVELIIWTILNDPLISADLNFKLWCRFKVENDRLRNVTSLRLFNETLW